MNKPQQSPALTNRKREAEKEGSWIAAALFDDHLDLLRRSMAARDLLAEDCEATGGLHTLWPLEVRGDTAVATGPAGQTLTFDVDSDEDVFGLRLRDPNSPFVPVCLWPVELPLDSPTGWE